MPQDRLTTQDLGLILDIIEYYEEKLDDEDLVFWSIDASPSSLVENIFDDIIRQDMKYYKRFKRLFFSREVEEDIEMFHWFDQLDSPTK